MTNLRDEYERRRAGAERRVRTLRSLLAALAWTRLALSLVLVAAVVAAYDGRLAAAWILLPAGTLAGAYAVEALVASRRDRAARTVALHEAGIARLDGRWIPVPFTGLEFVAAEHPAALDLDLVGERSLFARLSTARTRPGAATLARWLVTPADAATLARRREAVEELRGRLDLREAVHLAGRPGVAQVDAGAVARWGTAAPMLPWAWLRWPLGLVAWGLAASIAGAAAGGWGPVPLLVLGTAVLAAHVGLRARSAAVVAEVEEPLRQLGVVAEILAVLERETFRAPLLRELQGALREGGRASAAVGRLARTVSWLEDLRHGGIVAAVGYPMLWPSRRALGIERWRRAHGARVGAWLEALGALEALLSISTYADENPDHRYAELVDGGPTFQARGLGHPLLPPAICVANDVALGGAAPPLLLLTGSNMSGKSTLLRAVGMNAAMALAGVPVRAGSLALSRMAVGASIRTHDSVLDGESRFHAELVRLRSIVDLSRGPLPVLFLLDEILGGTNSHDRVRGAEAVLRDLVGRGAVGVCSTHDLALTRVAEALGERAANAHFGDRLVDGHLVFDYRLAPGVVTRSNAIALMRAMGLEVGEETPAPEGGSPRD
jgi:hypothetical protein